MDHDGEDGVGRGQASSVTPRVSIVLPVFNGAAHLRQTLESVLGQTEGDFELIAIDDGSTDSSPAILAEYASRDTRIRLITQANAGITCALIRGCDAAGAPLLARHDCGDISRPDRLRRMMQLLSERPACVAVSCRVAFIGPEGEALFTTTHAEKDVRGPLLRAGIDALAAPPHAAAVIRTEAYRRVGGYRAEFYFAQDTDLWIRMAAVGDLCIADEVLYEARVEVHGISSLHRAEQLASAAIALAIRDAPNDAQRSALLREASTIRPAGRRLTRAMEAKGLYFIAACLRRRKDPRWRRYASCALRRNPLNMRSWLLILRGGATT